MRAIVIDDEPLALESLVRMLERFQVTVDAAYSDPREVVRQMSHIQADIAFLDIDMPGLNGLDLAARLQTHHPDLEVVFVTAYDLYAVEAFELNAIDYLLKPVHPRRLEKALTRILKLRPESDAIRRTPVLCLLHHLSLIGTDGLPVEIPWRTAKAKELFAYLIHARDKGAMKEELTDLLWPEADEEKALANLHTTVYQIRQTFKSVDFPVKIVYSDGGYKLDLTHVELDVDQWEEALQQALSAGESGKLHQLLVNGYRGDYLGAEGFLWAENERERLRARWLAAAGSHAARLADAGLHGDAVQLYQLIQERFPLWEDSYAMLMQLYDKLGYTAEVMAQYAKLTRVMEEEVGMPPGPAVTEWYEAWKVRRSS